MNIFSALKIIIKNDLVKITWLIFVFFVGTLYVVQKREEVFAVLSTLNVSTVVLSLFLLTVAKILLSYNQLFSQRMFSQKISLPTNFYIYNYTQLMKYLPGVIWQYIGKTGEYRRSGFSSLVSVKIMTIEIVSLIAGSAFATVFFSIWERGLESQNDLGIVLIIIVITLIILHKLLSTKKTVFYRMLVPALILHLIIWSLIGTSFNLLLITEPAHRTLPLLVSTMKLNALSFVIGYISLFAPGGIGVREVVLAATLPDFGNRALVVAGAHRGLYILAELMLFAFSVVLMKQKKT